MKLYLVWNLAKNECVGFLDKRDALYASTGSRKYLGGPWTPSLADGFRDCYGDEAKKLPMTEVEI